MATNDVAKEYTRWNTEYVLSGIQLPLEFLQVLESFFDVGDEVVSNLRLNNHIVDVGLNILPDLVLEALLDSPLVGGTGVF